jgi:hypothetical protein
MQLEIIPKYARYLSEAGVKGILGKKSAIFRKDILYLNCPMHRIHSNRQYTIKNSTLL